MPYFWRYCATKTLWAGQVELVQVECRKGQIQEKKDAGKEGCMKGGMQKEGSQDWRDTGKEGSGQERYGMGEMLDRRDKGQLGGRTGGMQEWRESGL